MIKWLKNLIGIDKIAHFGAGIIGWMYFKYILFRPEMVAHLIVLALGGLWEFYFWKIRKTDKFCFIDWFFVCLGALAIHSVALNSWVHSPVGYIIGLLMFLRLRQIWWPK